jgi:sugar/nucleoside kinase (ribokinase family)
LRSVLARASTAAAITCSRQGAQPPYKHELPSIEVK